MRINMLFPVSLCLAAPSSLCCVGVSRDTGGEREVARGVRLGGGQGKFVALCDEPLCLVTNNSNFFTDNTEYHLDLIGL